MGELVPVRITRATSAVLYGELELAGVGADVEAGGEAPVLSPAASGS